MNDISTERNLRFQHLKSSGGSSSREFFASLDKHASLIHPLKKYYNFASNADYAHQGLSKAQYLSHPLRVAKLALDEVNNPSLSLVATCLLHNIKEVSNGLFQSSVIAENPQLSQAIEVLTIDRDQANNKRYIEFYYKSIANSYDFVGVVKVLDKLDNMFMLCLNNNDAIRNKYLDEIEEHVLPLAKLKVPHLLGYLTLLVEDCRETGFIDLDNI